MSELLKNDNPLNLLSDLMRSNHNPSVNNFLSKAWLHLASSGSDVDVRDSSEVQEKTLNIPEQLSVLLHLRDRYIADPVVEIFNDALRAFAVYCFNVCSGLDRARLLENIRVVNSHWMQPYGLLRAACMDACYEDVAAVYPNFDIPPEDTLAWLFVARAFQQERKFDQALIVCQSLVQSTPDHPVINELLANTLLDLGRDEEADVIFTQMASLYAWPFALARLSDEWFESLGEIPLDQPVISEGEDDLIFLIGCDENYAVKYLPGLVESMQSVYGESGWLLHAHIINPGGGFELLEKEFEAKKNPVRFSVEEIALPASTTIDARQVIEGRTYYACARFLILSEILALYKKTVWMIDCDLLATRDVRKSLQSISLTSDFDVAYINFDQPTRSVSEKVYASLSGYQPTSQGVRFAEVLRKYLLTMLEKGVWGWGLDQAAIFCTQRWFIRNEPTFKMLTLPVEFLDDGSGKYMPSPYACFKSLIGSINANK